MHRTFLLSRNVDRIIALNLKYRNHYQQAFRLNRLKFEMSVCQLSFAVISTPIGPYDSSACLAGLHSFQVNFKSNILILSGTKLNHLFNALLFWTSFYSFFQGIIFIFCSFLRKWRMRTSCKRVPAMSALSQWLRATTNIWIWFKIGWKIISPLVEKVSRTSKSVQMWSTRNPTSFRTKSWQPFGKRWSIFV